MLGMFWIALELSNPMVGIITRLSLLAKNLTAQQFNKQTQRTIRQSREIWQRWAAAATTATAFRKRRRAAMAGVWRGPNRGTRPGLNQLIWGVAKRGDGDPADDPARPAKPERTRQGIAQSSTLATKNT